MMSLDDFIVPAVAALGSRLEADRNLVMRADFEVTLKPAGGVAKINMSDDANVVPIFEA
jgi:hypothetical protein